jgi:hypothetical protein
VCLPRRASESSPTLPAPPTPRPPPRAARATQVVSNELAFLEQRASSLSEELAAARRRGAQSEAAARSKASEVEDLRAAYQSLATEHRRSQARRRACAAGAPLSPMRKGFHGRPLDAAARRAWGVWLGARSTAPALGAPRAPAASPLPLSSPARRARNPAGTP